MQVESRLTVKSPWQVSHPAPSENWPGLSSFICVSARILRGIAGFVGSEQAGLRDIRHLQPTIYTVLPQDASASVCDELMLRSYLSTPDPTHKMSNTITGMPEAPNEANAVYDPIRTMLCRQRKRMCNCPLHHGLLRGCSGAAETGQGAFADALGAWDVGESAGAQSWQHLHSCRPAGKNLSSIVCSNMVPYTGTENVRNVWNPSFS